MDRLQQTFQISAATTIAAAAVMFAVAEGSPLAALTLPLVLLALLVIDRPGRLGLPAPAAVLLGGVALVAAAGEFLVGGLEARLLAPAHFLTYLTWVVILQSKRPRQYWLLFGLSILQIAVAALLTTEPWFGLALVLFSFLALWTLSSFTVYRAAMRIRAGGETSKPPAHIPQVQLDGWSCEGSSAHSVSQHESELGIIGMRFAVGSIATSLLSLCLAALFFLYTPRVWLGQLPLFDNSALAAGLRPLSGFSEEVTLGDLGEILSNDELVLEVRLFDEDTGAAIPPEEYPAKLGGYDPLFRGMTHEIYSYGNWKPLQRPDFDNAAARSSEPNLLRQTIRLQPNGSTVLFVSGDARACVPEPGAGRIEFNSASAVFRRAREDSGTAEFNYDVLSASDSSGIRAGRSLHFNYWGGCLQLHPDTGRVADHALEIVLDHFGAWPPSRREAAYQFAEAAELLTGYLRDSGEFAYSLSLEVEDPGIDPLVDFVFNRKSGHCEYFASALVIMLRAVGIHSRLVGGFKGGNFNPDTDYYEIRQLHAHSWAEAFLDDEWVPLDPTPPDRELSVAGLENKSSSSISRWGRAWITAWESGVQLSSSEQDRLLYRPLQDSVADAWSALQDVRGSSARLGAFLQALLESPERWISWRGGVTASVLVAILVITSRLMRRVAGLLQRSRGTSPSARRSGPSVPFFDRFVRIVNRAGLERRDNQTQHEFAAQTQQRLAAALDAPPTARLPADITEKFYQVRFGHHPVSDEESESLNERLDALEDVFNRNGTRTWRSR